MKPTKAWQLLIGPEKWCRGEYALDSNGCPIAPESTGASRWCAIGAIRAIHGYDAEWATRSLCASVGAPIYIWNDAPERTWEEVYGKLRALDI